MKNLFPTTRLARTRYRKRSEILPRRRQAAAFAHAVAGYVQVWRKRIAVKLKLRRQRRPKYTLIAAGIALIVLGYLWYVRGWGVGPQRQAPQVVGDKMPRVFEWFVLTAMPTARTEVTAASVDGKIYVVGGFDGFGNTVTTVEVYDTRTDSWTTGPPLPGGRHHAAAVAIGQTLYIVGGMSGISFAPHQEVYAMDTKEGMWRNVASLPVPRGALAAAVLDGKIYAVGGVGPAGLTSELAVYDPTANTWMTKTPAPTKRDHLAAAAGDGLLYVVGGREQTLTKNLAYLEIYDPGRDIWMAGPPLPTARGGLAAAAFGGYIIALGGEQTTGTFAEVEAYEPEGNKWLTFPRLPTARHGLAAVAVDDSLYVIGGGKHPGLSVSGTNEALTISRQESLFRNPPVMPTPPELLP